MQNLASIQPRFRRRRDSSGLPASQPAENEACKVCPLFEYRSPGEEPSLPSLPSLPEGAALPEGAELGIAGFLILAGVISLFVGGPLWESTGMSAEDSMKAADSAPAFGFEPKRPDSPPSFGFGP